MSEAEAAYQLLPSLTDAEFASLKADIASRGVLVPIEYDDRGAILDGHHRDRAIKELRAEGVTVPDPPTVVRTFDSEDDKIAHVLTLNLARRHLSHAEKVMLAGELRQTGWSYRRVAEAVGVSAATVHRWWVAEGWSEADQAGVPNGTPGTDQGDDGPSVAPPDRSTGRDGKSYPRTRPKAAKHRPRTPNAATLSPPNLAANEDSSTTAPAPDAPPDNVRTVVIPDHDDKVRQWLTAGVALFEDEADRLVVQQYRDDAERVWAGLGRLLYPVRLMGTARNRGTPRPP